MASYVAAYRIGMLVSTAGALFWSAVSKHRPRAKHAPGCAGYVVMAALVLIGIVTTLFATEPEKSAPADAAHARETASRASSKPRSAHSPNFCRAIWRSRARLSWCCSNSPTRCPGHDRAVRDRSRLFAQRICRDHQGRRARRDLIGGFAGGFVARAYSLPASLWIGGLLQASPISRFPGRRWSASRTGAGSPSRSSAENFTSAIGTVIFVAYLSALCRNPLHTATQYALLTALAAVGRTYLSSGAGFIAASPAGHGFSRSARSPACRRCVSCSGCSGAATLMLIAS
jgi:PAT family beta-lactamase induction signal transducer AmpG